LIEEAAVMPAGRMHRGRLLAVLLAALALIAHSEEQQRVGSGRQLLRASDHRYKPKEDIDLYANKVGPYANPR
jgi:hypothetical protein